LTAFGLIAGVAVPVGVGVMLARMFHDVRLLLLPVPLLLLFALTARYAPRAYRIATDGLHVERRAGDFVVPYRAIAAVDGERRSLLGFGAGSRGFLGWFTFGRAFSPSLGLYRLFLTRRANIVWVQTDRGWLALSPDEPVAFVERLRARLASQPRVPGIVPPRRDGGSARSRR
jgi:hypothetical protein